MVSKLEKLDSSKKKHSLSYSYLPPFYDEKLGLFNTTEETRVVKFLGEEIDHPVFSFTKVESILEDRIKDLQKCLYNEVKIFKNEKKIFEDIMTDSINDVKVLEKDLYFRIKGNFETMANDINEQKSLNLVYQRQITSLKKEKNEITLELKGLINRLDELEKTLGISIKEKRENLEKRKNLEKTNNKN